MRLGLAAKLCVLATVLVLSATGASYLFFKDARTAMRDHERATLDDAFEHERARLLADFDRVHTDLLGLAVEPAVRAVFAPNHSPTDAERATILRLAEQLCRLRRAYRQIAFVGSDSAGTIVAEFPRSDASAPASRDVLALIRTSGPEQISFAKNSEQPSEMFAAIPASNGGAILLRFDLAVLADRLNRSARVLAFLVDDGRQYLAHPNRERIRTRATPDGDELDRRILQLADSAANRDPQGEPERIDGLKLPDLGYYLTTAHIAGAPHGAVAKHIAETQHSFPELRFSSSGSPGEFLFRGVSAERLREAMHDLKHRLGVDVEYTDPLRCETFNATYDVLRPRGVAVRAASAPWFVLGLAVTNEEIDRAIESAQRRNFLLILALSLAAGVAALAFAHYLTRPLRQMIGYADRITAGQEPEADLAVPHGHARDEIGTLTRAFSSMVDQVRTRTRELRESEARIRTILNTAAEGIITIDEHGNLESFNQAAERLFGYSSTEVRGKHFSKLLIRSAPTDLPTFFGFTSVSTSTPVTGIGGESSLMSISRVNGTTREVMARRKNGSSFPAELAVSEVILGDRLVYTAILRDVTERKQAQQASERMTIELERRVAERTAELMQANQALESARDLALEANRAKDAFLAVMSHELRTPLNAIIGYCDYWLGEADEPNTTEMLDDLRKMQVSGKHLLTLINDILDLAKIQAGKICLELGDFEVEQLLTELKEWVEPLIRKNHNTLTIEVDGSGDPSTTPRGDPSITPDGSGDPSTTAGGDPSTTPRGDQSTTPGGGQSTTPGGEQSTTPNLGTMRADRTRVRQVLLNLLSNAAKFTQSGAIRLNVHRQRATGRDEIVFRVSDTGVGMKPEDVRRLFRESFFQADSSSTRKHEGTGLGLVISSKLCRLMGGDIEVQSTLGVGTTFTVHLPMIVSPNLPLPATPAAEVVSVPRQAVNSEGSRHNSFAQADGTRSVPATSGASDGRRSATASSAETPTVPWQSPTVVVIDDDPASRAILERVLKKEGYVVRTAEAGPDAVGFVRELRPAAIVIDALAPGRDGWSALTALKADPDTATIPLIMATVVDDQSRGFTLSTDFLTKPIDWDRLGVILRPYRSAQTSAPVLIVDDDPATRAMTARRLIAQGWHVNEAANGREALEVLATTRPAVILLDLMMPEMDGFQFVERLRRDATWSKIPVVVVTAVDLTTADRERLRGSVQQILQKGAFTADELVTAIRDRLGQCVVPR